MICTKSHRPASTFIHPSSGLRTGERKRPFPSMISPPYKNKTSEYSNIKETSRGVDTNQHSGPTSARERERERQREKERERETHLPE